MVIYIYAVRAYALFEVCSIRRMLLLGGYLGDNLGRVLEGGALFSRTVNPTAKRLCALAAAPAILAEADAWNRVDWILAEMLLE